MSIYVLVKAYLDMNQFRHPNMCKRRRKYGRTKIGILRWSIWGLQVVLDNDEEVKFDGEWEVDEERAWSLKRLKVREGRGVV